MYIRTKFENGIKLVLAIAAIAAFTACDRSATEPSRSQARTLASAKHDDIKGDTTACLNGWVVLMGVYVCN